MSMFGIDLSRKNQSDTADLKFDEIIPMRVKTNTRIRQSDIDLIQTRIREECILLDDALDNNIAQSEADMELAEEIHRVKEMYAGMDPVDIDNSYEAELYQDERDYDTMKQEIMDRQEQATITHDENLNNIFQRVCDTAYQSQSEMPVEVTGRRSDGAKQTWVFVTQDTRNFLGEQFAAFESEDFNRRINKMAESGKVASQEKRAAMAERSQKTKEIESQLESIAEAADKQKQTGLNYE